MSATSIKRLAMSFIAIVSTGLATVVAADQSAELGFAAFANYGFGGVMTGALGYALWGLYRAHNEERKTWLDKWETHFQRLLDTLRESDKARHELAEEVRLHLRTHEGLSEEIKSTLARIASALDKRSP